MSRRRQWARSHACSSGGRESVFALRRLALLGFRFAVRRGDFVIQVRRICDGNPIKPEKREPDAVRPRKSDNRNEQQLRQLSSEERAEFSKTGELPERVAEIGNEPASVDDGAVEAKPDPHAGLDEKSRQVLKRHQENEEQVKRYNELPERLVKDLISSGDFNEVQAALAKMPMSDQLGELLRHCLAASEQPGRVLRYLTENPNLVAAMPSFEAQTIVAAVREIDSKFKRRTAAPAQRVTKAPPPARENITSGGASSSTNRDPLGIR